MRLAIVFAALLGAGSAAQASDEWIAVSAANGKFHFLMPVAPTSETSKETEDGIPVTTTVYVAQTDAMVTSGSFTEYQSDTAQIGLPIFLTAFLQGLNGQLVSNEKAPYQRGPDETLEGALVTIKKDDMDCKLRVAIDRIHAYTILACVAHGSGNDAQADRVLASFKIDP
jgi:hypothetical protein